MSQSAIFANVNFGVITGSAYSASFYQRIPNVTSIQGPTFSRESISVTSMESVAEEYKAARIADAGEISFTVQYVPTDAIHGKLLAYAVTSSANQINGYRMLFSDNSAYEFSGSVTSFATNAPGPANDILTADVTIRLTGAVSFS